MVNPYTTQIFHDRKKGIFHVLGVFELFTKWDAAPSMGMFISINSINDEL